MLTRKEKAVLRLLMGAFDSVYSINQIAKECNLAPNGALKILRKFGREGILESKDIANIKSYRINFDNEKTSIVLELVLMSELEGRLKHRMDDLKELKEVSKCCILFGSYINLRKEPHDLDVLFVVDKENYRGYKRRLSAVKDIIPVKVHDVVQTEEDLVENIKKGDNVILEIIRKGIILWGQRIIVGVIKDAYKR